MTDISVNHSFLVMSLISCFIKNKDFDETLVQILDTRCLKT